MLKAIVFDFDGVILESMDLKARAFRRLFEVYPEHQGDIVRLHLENGGMSRYEKFQHIYTEILHLPLSGEEMTLLDGRFATIVAEEILDCPYVLGAREFVERHAAEYQLFIASGAPESEVQTIVSRRGLAPFFTGVYGSPRSKPALLREIQERVGVQPKELLFIGDAPQDYHAAVEAGVPFVARVATDSSDPFPGKTLTRVRDLLELETIWPSLIEQFA